MNKKKMKEAGKVVEIKGDEARLQFNRTSMCSKCGACGMTAGKNTIIVSVKNSLNARIGDTVEIEFESGNVLTSSLIAYIFPLIMLFIGIWIGYSVPQSLFEIKDVMAAILGLIFCALSFVILKILNPFLKRKFSNIYTMVRIQEQQ